MDNKHFRSIWLEMGRQERERLAARIGTSYNYLQRISGGFATPSLPFAVKLREELPGLDFTGFIKASEEAGKRTLLR